MTPSSSACFLVGCFAIASWFSSCSAMAGWSFIQDLQHMNKKMAGDAVVTYYDVTAGKCAARCTSKNPCSGFAYNEEERVCTLCGLCGDFRLVDAPGYRFYAMAGLIDTSKNQANICPDDMVSPQNCWKSTGGLLAHVAVGPLGVWAVNGDGDVFYRTQNYRDPFNIGSSWKRTDGIMRQLDIGDNLVWGIDYYGRNYNRESITRSSPAGTSWHRHEENIRLKWICVKPSLSRWGSDTTNRVAYRGSAGWLVKGRNIQRVDADLAGVWVLNTTGQLLYRVGTYGDNGSPGTEWRALEGTFQSVASGRDLMVAVDMAGHVWLRTGVGPNTPTGLGWVQYPGFMKQVDVYQTDEGAALWGVDSAGESFFSVLMD
ncbi:perivitellin-2 31 kDa subunit-like [Babylonia areolata]|uniref:perivitellin-2 31 kDa subunit-like n=1 Tax=Babylonia areolata TaxID=304850 RepID=UPI003FD0C126